MRYISTRGGGPVSFEAAVLAGWADDGGMLLPERLEELTTEELTAWASYSYPELCVALLRRMIAEEELPTPDLKQLVATSLTVFEAEAITPIHDVAVPDPLAEGGKRTLHICELWHGPTLAFKDLGLQILGNMLEYFLAKRQTTLNVLVGTSGDTGSAAIEAVTGKPHLNIFVLFPHGRISHIQELQMTSHVGKSSNVHVWGVEGTSDDLDRPISALFQDIPFKRERNLGSMNSVNVVRVLMQTVHYFFAYFRVVGSQNVAAKAPVRFYIPTGAGGHMISGIMAKRLGLPVQLYVATNENDFMVHLLLRRELQMKAEVLQTNSPSMDIQVPYNIERLFYLIYEDAGLVGELMRKFYATGGASVPEDLLERLHAMVPLEAGATTDAQVREVIQRIAEVADGYLIDPHTAVAAHAALLHHGPAEASAVPRVVMACAHAAKFPETVAQSLGLSVDEARQHILAHAQGHKHVLRVTELHREKVAYPILAKGEDWAAILRQAVISAPVAKQS